MIKLKRNPSLAFCMHPDLLHFNWTNNCMGRVRYQLFKASELIVPDCMLIL